MNPRRSRPESPNSDPEEQGVGGVGSVIAATLARAALWLYPRPFRSEVGTAVVRDIREQIRDLAREGGTLAAWRRIPGIVASLIVTGAAAWRERLRAGRGAFASIRFSALDFKVGLRMAARHPGVSLVGILGMTVAITIGATFASAVGIFHATLPFDDGDRLVAIENWDLTISNQEYRNTRDYLSWRDELETVEDLGAYRTMRRNLIGSDGHTESITVAETTAATFRLPGVPPLLGRPLVDEDVRTGAEPVLVLGHRVWRARFAADPTVLGRDVRVGSATYAVVGVMPEGFAFPMSHDLWIPFHVDAVEVGRREGPRINIFGRLAEGATLETAQAELSAAGERTSESFPETHRHIRPSVIRYAAVPFDDLEGFEIPLVGALVVLLLVVVSANVATLIYARSTARREELLVRAALGASRSRLVGQLFVEATVVASSAALLGLAVTAMVLERLNVAISAFARSAPFWLEFRLTPATVVSTFALALLGALITGVLPGMASTAGHRLHAGLQTRGGAANAGMGRVWTTLIVSQVAFAVAVLPAAVFVAWETTRYAMAEPGFPAAEFMAGYINIDPGSATVAGDDSDGDSGSPLVGPRAAAGATDELDVAARYAVSIGELASRLQDDLGATGVTFASLLPSHEGVVRIELETSPLTADPGTSGPPSARAAATYAARQVLVEPRFFEVLGIAQLEGGSLGDGDAGSGSSTVVVNRSFVDKVLAGASASGRRVRYVRGYRAGGVERDPVGTEAGRWYEIVGVVEDFPPRATEPGATEARVYHAAASGDRRLSGMIARIPTGTPADVIQRTRDIAAAVDPAFRFTRLASLESMLLELRASLRLGSLALLLVTLSVTLLSTAGLSALISFVVVRRRREIGIRSALGAHRILMSIFSRVLGQLGIGIATGLLLAYPLCVAVGQEMGIPVGTLFLVAVPALVTGVGALAALGPARRGLRIEPTEAFRE